MILPASIAAVQYIVLPVNSSAPVKTICTNGVVTGVAAHVRHARAMMRPTGKVRPMVSLTKPGDSTPMLRDEGL